MVLNLPVLIKVQGPNNRECPKFDHPSTRVSAAEPISACEMALPPNASAIEAVVCETAVAAGPGNRRPSRRQPRMAVAEFRRC